MGKNDGTVELGNLLELLEPRFSSSPGGFLAVNSLFLVEDDVSSCYFLVSSN